MPMTDHAIWLAILGLTVITVLSRSLFLLAGSRITIPPRVQHALRYAPAAALVALIVPELFSVDGMLAPDPMHNPKLLAGVATGIVFFYSRHMVLTIAAGMTVYTALRLLSL